MKTSKRKALYAVCLSALMISLPAGCGKQNSDMTPAQSQGMTETGSFDRDEGGSRPASQGENPEAATSENPSEAAGVQKEENPMQTVLQALAATTGDSGLHYNSGDPAFIWTALSYAAHADGLGESVPEETLERYLSAFFEGVEDLPPIGSVQNLVSYDDAAKTYSFATVPDPKGALFLGEPEDLEDGSYRIKGEYMAADGWEKLSGWIFFVRPSEGAYPYVVQYMENEDYLCSDIYEELQSLTAADPTEPK